MSEDLMTLKEYLEGGYTLPSNLNSFNSLSYINDGLTIYDLFYNRNYHKYLGTVDPDDFKDNLENLIFEALAKYNLKIKLLSDNIANVMKRTVTETVTGSNSSSGDNKNYLNPANTSASKLTGKDESTSIGAYSETRERSFSYIKSNPELIKLSQDLDTVAYSILKHLDRAFLGEI